MRAQEVPKSSKKYIIVHQQNINKTGIPLHPLAQHTNQNTP